MSKKGIITRQSISGTVVTQPRYSFWLEGHGWGVENHGVDPDVEVVIGPQDWAAGRDPQLERAVDMALEALAARPAVTPPDGLPTLLVPAIHGGFVRPRWVRACRAALGDTLTVEEIDAGHMVYLECADEVAGLLRPFLLAG